jgi:hypothetical protein
MILLAFIGLSRASLLTEQVQTALRKLDQWQETGHIKDVTAERMNAFICALHRDPSAAGFNIAGFLLSRETYVRLLFSAGYLIFLVGYKAYQS